MGAIPIIQNIAIQNQGIITPLTTKQEVIAIIVICVVAFLVGVLLKLSDY